MDDTTQQNAALVEEAASAAKSMEPQAQQLSVPVAARRAPAAVPVPMAKASGDDSASQEV